MNARSSAAILGQIWAQFGHMDRWKLRDYTHDGGRPEWEDPEGSSRPIPMQRLLEVLGFSQEGIESFMSLWKERNDLHRAMTQCAGALTPAIAF